MMSFQSRLFAWAALACALNTARADVRMPAIFGDHMVLQRESTVPVWGWAEPGEKVSVTFGSQTANAVADKDGKWRTELTAIPSSAQAGTLTVVGKNTLTFQDVLVGDVWLASGQSNMEFGINKKYWAEDVDKAADPLLRLFWIPKTTALTPQSDLILGDPAIPYAGAVTQPTTKKDPDPYAGKWVLCTPEALRTINRQGFASTAYFFSREIRARHQQPMGIIDATWGGTRAESWTSLAGLKKEPPFANYIKTQEKNVAQFPELEPTYLQRKAAYDIEYPQWQQEIGKAWDKENDAWKIAAEQARVAGQPIPPQPKPSKPRPQNVNNPDSGPNGPANLFNAMIAPVIPFAMKGVIWYQGEFNSGFDSGIEYRTLFPRMINSWREASGRGDFPFVFVQLPNFGPVDSQPSVEGGGWRWIREAQLQALSLPNTAMAITIDVGDPSDLHPPDKIDVGKRLALAASRLAYGENIVASGPLYESMKVENGKIRISFKERGTGLTIGVSPYHPKGVAPELQSELQGFGIAGDDHVFVWAKAEIDGETVVVSSDKVPAPVAVRYNFSNSPKGNLYNKEGLPASPFRTDTWDEKDK